MLPPDSNRRDSATDDLKTFLGTPYREMMIHSASIGSIIILNELIDELASKGALNEEYNDLASFASRASEFERQFGDDCLLDLKHPAVQSLIASVIPEKKLQRIQRRQHAISADPVALAQAESLRSEGGHFV